MNCSYIFTTSLLNRKFVCPRGLRPPGNGSCRNSPPVPNQPPSSFFNFSRDNVSQDVTSCLTSDEQTESSRSTRQRHPTLRCFRFAWRGRGSARMREFWWRREKLHQVFHSRFTPSFTPTHLLRPPKVQCNRCQELTGFYKIIIKNRPCCDSSALVTC